MYFLLGLLGIIIFVSVPVISNFLEIKKKEREKRVSESDKFFAELSKKNMRDEIKKELISEMRKKKKKAKKKK